MNSKTISVDLAKDVFEVAVANDKHRIIERHRLNRPEFREFLQTHSPTVVVTEACGSAHYWGRVATDAGHEVRMLPARYVSPYRKRGKSDRIDVEAILEANRSGGIIPVPVRSEEQHQIQQLHRIREQWKKTRNQRINALRGFLSELGHVMPTGAKSVPREAHRILSEESIPPILKSLYSHLLDEIKDIEESMKQAEKQIALLTRENTVVQRLRQIPGIGLLSSTALLASVGDIHRFSSGRKLASWLGMTPRENSSGNTHRLGKITKQGDTYVRMLLTHGARSVLARAKVLERRDQTLSSLQRWAVSLERRVGHNKATCALANKLARLCWAVWAKDMDYKPAISIID